MIWGASDRIVTPAYGQALADSIPGGRFAIVPDAGHLPHLERPDATFEVLDTFLATDKGVREPSDS